jgi:hypothetical protein
MEARAFGRLVVGRGSTLAALRYKESFQSLVRYVLEEPIAPTHQGPICLKTTALTAALLRAFDS